MRKLYKQPKPIFIEEIEWYQSSEGDKFKSIKNGWQKFMSKYRKQLVDVLSIETNNMCAYCETSLVGSGNIEHIMPKSLFPEGMYDWNNLTLICPQCNSRKTNRILPINPYLDEPSNHFSFENNGQITPKTAKGAEVIDVLSLNRTELYNSRLKTIRFITDLIDKNDIAYINRDNFDAYWGCIEFIFKTELNKERLSFSKENIPLSKPKISSGNLRTKSKFTNWLEFDLDNEENDDIKKYRQKKLLIESIHIKNFKSIKDVKFEFGDLLGETVPSLILIGENGTGKSSILQSIVLGLLGQKSLDKKKKGKLSNEYLRICKEENITKGSIEIKLTDLADPIKLTFNSKTVKLTTSGRKMPVLAYGSTRLLSKKVPFNKSTNGLNIENLFNSKFELIGAEAWLLSLSDEEFKYVCELVLRDILMLKEHETIIRNENKILIHPANIDLNLWSDGYKSVISLVCDILYNMQNLWKKEVRAINDYSGIVIIDEVEQHLHPTWKQEIIPRLKSVFPQIQFIIATHDPLCIQNTSTSEVFLLSKEENNETKLHHADVPSGLNIDKLLTGKWFSLQTTFDKQTIQDLTEYQRAVLLSESEEELTAKQNGLNKKLGAYADNSFWGLYRESIRELEMNEKVFFEADEKEEIKKKIKSVLQNKR